MLTMIKFHYIEEEKKHILNIVELLKFRDLYNDFYIKNDTSKLHDYYLSLVDYLNWFLRYSDSIFKTKTFNEEQISIHIFRTSFKTEHQFKEYLHKSLYVAKLYIEHLISVITESNIRRYKHTLMSLDTDLEKLIANFEVVYRKSIPSISLTSGRRTNLTPTDIYSASRELFYIEECDDLENIYLRDLKPVVMFQVRQLTELFGKNILGYFAIVDSNGDEIKKFTQEAWKFIKAECRKPDSRIEFPFNINVILSINDWSNSFVHTTHIYSSFIQFYALKSLNLLFKPISNGIKTYDGRIYRSTEFTDIKINNYNSLKADFEKHLRERISDINVEWKPNNKVGAYIISL